jgi:hypothetical protein
MNRQRKQGRASDAQGGVHSILVVILAVLALVVLSALASLAAVALDAGPAEGATAVAAGIERRDTFHPLSALPAVVQSHESDSTIAVGPGSPFPTGPAVMDPIGRTGQPVLPVVATTTHTRRP